MDNHVYIIVNKNTKQTFINRVYLTEKNAIEQLENAKYLGYGKDYSLYKYSMVATRENGEWTEKLVDIRPLQPTGIEGPFDLSNPMDYVSLKDYYIEREGFISDEDL
jgi:hypothetical protein